MTILNAESLTLQKKKIIQEMQKKVNEKMHATEEYAYVVTSIIETQLKRDNPVILKNHKITLQPSDLLSLFTKHDNIFCLALCSSTTPQSETKLTNILKEVNDSIQEVLKLSDSAFEFGGATKDLETQQQDQVMQVIYHCSTVCIDLKCLAFNIKLLLKILN